MRRLSIARRLVPPSQAPSRSISFRWAVCNKDSPTRACTWVRVSPSGCRNVTLTFSASAATVGPPCHRIPVVLLVVGIDAVVTTDGGPAVLVRKRICFERSFAFDVPRIFFFGVSKYVFYGCCAASFLPLYVRTHQCRSYLSICGGEERSEERGGRSKNE